MLVRGCASLAAVVLRCWLHGYDRLTIVGRQNLPADRSFILVANHASHLDTLCLLSALPVRQLHRTFPVAASEYFCVNRCVVLPREADRQRVAVRSTVRLLAEFERVRTAAAREAGQHPDPLPRGDAHRRLRAGRVQAGRRAPGGGPRHSRRAVPPRRHACRPAEGSVVSPGQGGPTHDWHAAVYAHLPATKESRTHICRELREAVMSLGHAEPEA